MKAYSLSHLSDHTLLRDLSALVAQDRVTTAAMLAHLAEVDARKLYLPAGYPSMYAWCVGVLKLSEDSAAKRIQAARLARRFSLIFPMLADGRLHLSSVVLLAPHLGPDNADDLLAAAASKSKPELERLIAERFPRPDLPTLVRPLAVCEIREQHAPGHVDANIHKLPHEPAGAGASAPAVTTVAAPSHESTPGPVAAPAARRPRCMLRPRSRARNSRRCHLAESRCRSRSHRPRTTSCAMRRSCWGTPCLPAISRRCSIERWMR